MGYGAVFAAAVDATGGSLALPVGARDVENLRPVDLVESGVVLAEVLDLPLSGGFRRGSCWGVLVPSGDQWLVVLMGTTPEELAGDGLEIGRLTDDDAHRWGPRFRGRDLRVAIVVDGTPGLDRVEVRFRSDLLARTPTPAPAPPPVAAVTATTAPHAGTPDVAPADVPAAAATPAAGWVAPPSWAAPTDAPPPAVPEVAPTPEPDAASAETDPSPTTSTEPEPPVAETISGTEPVDTSDAAVVEEPAWSAREHAPGRAEDEAVPTTARDEPGGPVPWVLPETDEPDATTAAGGQPEVEEDRSVAAAYPAPAPATEVPVWEAPTEPHAVEPVADVTTTEADGAEQRVADEAVEWPWSTADAGRDRAGDPAPTYDAALTDTSAVGEPMTEEAQTIPADMPSDDVALGGLGEAEVGLALDRADAAALDGTGESTTAPTYADTVVLTARPPVTEADLEGVPGPPPPAGWYVDPHDDRFWRYWDGTQWTPAAAAHPLPAAP